LLRLHGAAVRVDARPGHLGKCAEQVGGRARLWIYCRLDHRSLWPSPRHDGRHPDGRWSAGGTGLGLDSRHVLFVLLLQRSGIRVRRTAAEPGFAIALVRQVSRQGHGLRIPGNRDRRRDRTLGLARTYTAFRLAISLAIAGWVDHSALLSIGFPCKGGALPTHLGSYNERIPGGDGSVQNPSVLPAHVRQYV